MRVRLPIFLASVVVLTLLGCASEEAHPPPHGRFHQSGPITGKQIDPLAHALQIMNLQVTDLQRPSAREQDYRPLARLPLIDQLSRSHFYLQHWAESTSQRLLQAGENGIDDLFPAAVQAVNPGFRIPGRTSSDMVSDLSLADAYRRLCDRFDSIADKKTIGRLQQAELSPAFDKELALLVMALSDAAFLLDQAYANLSAEESARLLQQPARYFYPDGQGFNFLTAPTHVQTEILAIAQKIDLTAVCTAAFLISEAVDTLIHSLGDKRHPSDYFQNGSGRTDALLEFPTPLGRIVIAGTGDDVHTTPAFLTIDLAGNDTYRMKKGSSSGSSGRVSVLIDLNGNDTYASQGRSYVQGFGCLGADVLVDRQGNDRYRAGDMAQGCGLFGVGLLADYEGDDTYEMGLLGQGFGLFGVGVLLDRRGNDRYTVSGLGQGVGSTMGTGLLCDLQGNDKYLADRSRSRGQLPPDDWSHVQGVGISVRSPDWGNQASLYGGVGFISDGEGDDFYYSSSEHCMGAGYFLSVGALVDHGGNDWYLPEKGLGIGWAIHLGSAVFIDLQGDDRYYGNMLSGGTASDRSIAIMIDYAGNDIYGPSEDYLKTMVMREAQNQQQPLSEKELRARVRSRLAQNAYGSARKPKAFGILIDYRGNDRYTEMPNGFGGSFGGLIPPAGPENWSHALFMDLGGQDAYSHPGKKNNHYFTTMGHALCYDTENTSTSFGSAAAPVAAEQPSAPAVPVTLSRSSLVAGDIRRLQNPDVFLRFAARGRITRSAGPATADDLLRLLTTSADTELNLELLEIMDQLLLTGQIKNGLPKALVTLLEAEDPNVRAFAAGKLGYWKIRSGLKSLLKMGNDPDETARLHVIRAIGRTAPEEAVDFLLRAGNSASPIACRREAFLALSTWVADAKSAYPKADQKIRPLMINALGDADEVIRTAAAAALKCCGSDPEVHKALSERLADQSVYVQRAAARSLAASGTKSGVAALIETLRFPSIDTRSNYDRDLAKELAFYCGIDFPDDSRYRYDTWKKWWNENQDSVNLKQNLNIQHQIEQAFAMDREKEAISIFETLRAQYPDNVVIRNRYAHFCREWIRLRLMTRRIIDRPILQQSLHLQEILTRLEPERAENWVGLAYFQYRLGNYQMAVGGIDTALKIDPHNASYLKKRKVYRHLLEEKTARQTSPSP